VIRRLVAGLIVVGLAVGIWALWPRDDSETATTTLPAAVDSTTSTSAPSTTSTTTVESTTTSTSDVHVVTTVEEAETILRELWFGWFEGIYNQDEDRIKEVVGTHAMVDAARRQFGAMEFLASPASDQITLSNLEILRSDQTCLATWIALSATFRPGSAQGVQVLRYGNSGWVFVGFWANREDLWEADCESQFESSP